MPRLKKIKKTGDLIIGVDPSLTNTGVVMLNTRGEVLGTIETKNFLKDWHKLDAQDRNSSAGQINRLLLLTQEINRAIGRQIPRGYQGKISVGYEDYSFDSVNRPFSMGELGGVLKCALASLPAWFVHFQLVAPTEVKKFALGRGDCKDKEPVITQAIAEEPAMEGRSSDICDAYFLAKFAWYCGYPEEVVAHEKNKDNLRMRLEMCAERMRKCK